MGAEEILVSDPGRDSGGFVFEVSVGSKDPHSTKKRQVIHSFSKPSSVRVQISPDWLA
jgi:hypothetical protein